MTPIRNQLTDEEVQQITRYMELMDKLGDKIKNTDEFVEGEEEFLDLMNRLDESGVTAAVAKRVNRREEKAARTMARLQGLVLRKSRRRNRDAPDYGCYNLFDKDTGAPVFQPNDGRFECDRFLNEVVTYLNNRQ